MSLTDKSNPMKKRLLILFALISTFSMRAADGDSIWGVNFIHDIYFNFTQNPYWDTLLANYSADRYTSCEMIFDGTVLPSTGVRFKGNSSYNVPGQKKSFKVDLNEFVAGQDYDGIKKFNLNNLFKDPTFIREKLTLDYMRRHNIHAPRCTYARVYLNNVYWGLYTLVEDVNSKFLSQHYNNNNGNLFKGDPTGDLKWFGNTVSSYTAKYELDQTSTNDWTDLIELIDSINNATTATYYSSVESVMFGQDAISNMVINNMFVNLDSYCGSGHNYYIYHDSLQGAFRWIPWDVNETFGTFTMGMTPTQLKNLTFDYINQPNNRPFAVKFMADPTYRQIYISTYCYLMQDFTNAYLDPYIDSVANVIRTDVYADPNKFYTNQEFENNLTSDITIAGPPNGQTILGLKDFITARRSSLITQLSAFGCWLSDENNTAMTFTESFSVFPNPAHNIINFAIPSTWENSMCTVKVIDLSGRTVLSSSLLYATGTQSLEIDLLSEGAYFLFLSNTSGQSTTAGFTVSAD